MKPIKLTDPVPGDRARLRGVLRLVLATAAVLSLALLWSLVWAATRSVR